MKEIKTYEEMQSILTKTFPTDVLTLNVFSEKEMYNSLYSIDPRKTKKFTSDNYVDFKYDCIISEVRDLIKRRYHVFCNADMIDRIVGNIFDQLDDEITKRFTSATKQFWDENKHLFNNKGIYIEDYTDLTKVEDEGNKLYTVKNNCYLDADNRDYAIVYIDGILIRDKLSHAEILSQYMFKYDLKDNEYSTLAFGSMIDETILFDSFSGKINFKHLKTQCLRQYNVKNVFIVEDVTEEIKRIKTWKKL